MNAKAQAGVSLVEVMVGLAVLGIILSLAAPSFADLLNARRVQAVAADISSDLAFARAETGLRPQNVIVYFNQNTSLSCYTIAYYGAGGNCNCTRSGASCNGSVMELKSRHVPSSIGVSFSPSATWLSPASVGRVSFTAPQMTPNLGDFVVNVNGVRGAQLRVSLNAMGRVSTCTPNNSINGVASC